MTGITAGQMRQAVAWYAAAASPDAERTRTGHGAAELPAQRPAAYEEEEEAGEGAERLMELTLRSFDELVCLDNIHTKEEMERAGEIYAISIRDGRVCVSGGSGYEDKAAACEKLLNASLRCVFRWEWGMGMVAEEQVLEKLDGILHSYMEYDEKLYREQNGASIVDHVVEAFDWWQEEHRPKGRHFEQTV